MGAVQNGDITQLQALAGQFPDLPHNPAGFRRCGFRMMVNHLLPGGQQRDQFFADAVFVLANQGVGHRHDLRCRPIILHHQDRPDRRKFFGKIQNIPDAGASPGIDRLIRVADDEQVVMVGAQHLHQPVLQIIDILIFVNHDVFQPLLPLETNLGVDAEQMQYIIDQIIVVEPKTFFLLIKIAPENDVVRFHGVEIFLAQPGQGQRNHVLVIGRIFEHLADFDHIPRFGEGHVVQRQSAFLIDDLQHRIDVGVVQHQKTFRVLQGMDVFLQNGHAKTVKRTDVARIAVAGETADALLHLVGGFVGERDAQDMGRQDAHLVDEIGKPVGQRPGLTRSRPRDHADIAFRCRYSLPLRFVETRQQFAHFSHNLTCLDFTIPNFASF